MIEIILTACHFPSRSAFLSLSTILPNKKTQKTDQETCFCILSTFVERLLIVVLVSCSPLTHDMCTQRKQSTQGHFKSSFFWCLLWADHPDHVYRPKHTELLPCDWFTRYLELSRSPHQYLIKCPVCVRLNKERKKNHWWLKMITDKAGQCFSLCCTWQMTVYHVVLRPTPTYIWLLIRAVLTRLFNKYIFMPYQKVWHASFIYLCYSQMKVNPLTRHQGRDPDITFKKL